MTHKDIYTKFMIEYDKANVTSSYPSLTEYEVATILDKAYNALIAQKVTGNNVRRAPFEADLKAVEDLKGLLTRASIAFDEDFDLHAPNVSSLPLPNDHMYFVQLLISYEPTNIVGDRLEEDDVYDPENLRYKEEDPDIWVKKVDVYYGEVPFENQVDLTYGTAYDNVQVRSLPVKLVSHEIAEKFFTTSYNMPWIKAPLCFIEGDKIYVVYDLLKKPHVEVGDTAKLVYIKQPNKFAIKENSVETVDFSDETVFQLSDTIAEELINLAIIFALENVESSRLNSKLNTRGLEA